MFRQIESRQKTQHQSKLLAFLSNSNTNAVWLPQKDIYAVRISRVVKYLLTLIYGEYDINYFMVMIFHTKRLLWIEVFGYTRVKGQLVFPNWEMLYLN